MRLRVIPDESTDAKLNVSRQLHEFAGKRGPRKEFLLSRYLFRRRFTICASYAIKIISALTDGGSRQFYAAGLHSWSIKLVCWLTVRSA